MRVQRRRPEDQLLGARLGQWRLNHLWQYLAGGSNAWPVASELLTLGAAVGRAIGNRKSPSCPRWAELTGRWIADIQARLLCFEQQTHLYKSKPNLLPKWQT